MKRDHNKTEEGNRGVQTLLMSLGIVFEESYLSSKNKSTKKESLLLIFFFPLAEEAKLH